VNALVPALLADGLKRRLAHVFVIGLMVANRMLAEFQMRCDVPISEQGKAHFRAQCQNAFKNFPGDNPEALDAGIIEHAYWVTQFLRNDRTKPETMPLFGPEIGRRHNEIRPHHAREADRDPSKLAEPL
jgi:hypothetical protein